MATEVRMEGFVKVSIRDRDALLARLDISIVWARTWPREEPPHATRFAYRDAAMLRAAGRAFRSRDEE